ncbi:general transcription factor 3C polypeptide 6 isoform X2 [Brachionichthys hirsutus]|uniref:general transcription factor 3C polypeptide 6 isoform X2 n=1 Tax=Brachionichthys hirsutus TaxID=412623 RepID=UPI003604AB68
MEDEWEEEEQLVVVELSGVINSDCLSKCPGACTILDIDSEKPMMQIGQYVFAGEYEETLGTCVLFEEGPNKGHSGTGPDLKYTCHTGKKLMMQRIFLTEKKEGETSRVVTLMNRKPKPVCPVKKIPTDRMGQHLEWKPLKLKIRILPCYELLAQMETGGYRLRKTRT